MLMYVSVADANMAANSSFKAKRNDLNRPRDLNAGAGLKTKMTFALRACKQNRFINHLSVSCHRKIYKRLKCTDFVIRLFKPLY